MLEHIFSKLLMGEIQCPKHTSSKGTWYYCVTVLGCVLAVSLGESHCCNCYSAQKLEMYLDCKSSDL